MASSNRSVEKFTIKSPPRSTVNLSHEKKMSFGFGHLVPVFWEDVVPSDLISLKIEFYIRFAPMLAPIMHRIDARVHTFYVPYRLVWEDAEEFFTGGEDGTSAPVVPYFTYDNGIKASMDKGMIMDYLGIPPTAATITQDININLLSLRCYLQIFNDYYRNLNRQNERSFSVASGNHDSDLTGNNELRACQLEADYFTSALPTAQRGNAVELDIDIYGESSAASSLQWENASAAVPAVGAPAFNSRQLEDSGGSDVRFRDNTLMPAVATLEVTELRRAARLQEFLELANIAGGHYHEQMEVYFGQRSNDQRAQRAEYLGGHTQPVQVSEITSTAESLVPSSDALSTPVGDASGKAISMGASRTIKRQFPEHGMVMSILSVVPRTSYFEGIDKFYTKTDRTEWLWPKFAQLGEQPITQSEIYWDPVGTDKDDTFAYQSRYAEYKWKKSSVHGDFIDDFNYWHLTREIGGAPIYDSGWGVCENTDYDHIFAVTTGTIDKLFAQVYNDCKMIRPLPGSNIPTL